METVPSTPEKIKEVDPSKLGGKITRPWDAYLEENKGKWKELSIKGDSIQTKLISTHLTEQKPSIGLRSTEKAARSQQEEHES